MTKRTDASAWIRVMKASVVYGLDKNYVYQLARERRIRVRTSPNGPLEFWRADLEALAPVATADTARGRD